VAEVAVLPRLKERRVYALARSGALSPGVSRFHAMRLRADWCLTQRRMTGQFEVEDNAA